MCGNRIGQCKKAPSDAPKVHFTRQPTATPWEKPHPKRTAPARRLPRFLGVDLEGFLNFGCLFVPRVEDKPVPELEPVALF